MMPLPDYDHLSVGDLGHRIRTLSADEIEQLLAYERAHAARPQVIEMLAFRHSQAETEAKEPGGGGTSAAPPPGPPPEGGSPVSPATSPEPFGPPPHGTQDQRGKPKGNRRA